MSGPRAHCTDFFSSPEGELCVFCSGPLQPSRKMGGGGRSGREEQGWGVFLMGVCAWISRAPRKKKLGDGRRGTALVCAGFGEPGGRAECVLVEAPPTIKEDGGRGEIRGEVQEWRFFFRFLAFCLFVS